MKKVFLATMLAATTLAMSAQADALKDLQNQMKGKNPDYKAITTQIEAVLVNPETATDVDAWMLGGKANTALYSNLNAQRAIGQTDVDIPLMGKALMQGVKDYIGALPFDSVPDAKGKIKAKNSKEIIKQVNTYYPSLYDVAAILFNDAKDFNGAYEAFDMYLTLPDNPVLGANAPKAQADTIRGEVAYNKAIAAWQAENLDNALKSFKQALKFGYNKKHVYDYALGVAAALNSSDDIVALAQEAYPIYGSEDPKYLLLMINGKIEAKQFDEARSMLNEAIAAQPDNGQLYFALGILEENLDNMDAAIEDYKKAVTLDPTIAQAQYYAGRAICNVAYAIDDKAGQGTAEEYNKVRQEQVNPMFKEASVYLEKAYELDPENMRDALIYLKNVYYNVNDEANLNRVESLLN